MNYPAVRGRVILLCCMLVILLAGFVVRDYLDLKATRQDWSTEAGKLATLKDKIARIKAEVAGYESEKAEFQKYLFKEQDVPAFLDSISAFAQKAEVQVVDMKTRRFRAVKTPAPLTESQSRLSGMKQEKKAKAEADSEDRLKRVLTLASMPISIKTEGTFAALLEFFARFDDFAQLLTITDVQIASGRDYPVLKCSFTLTIYSLKTIEELEYP